MINSINQRRGFFRKYVLPKTIYSRLILVIIIPIILVQFFFLFTFSYRHGKHTSYALSISLINEIKYFLSEYEKNPQEASEKAKNLGMDVKEIKMPINIKEQYKDRTGEVFISEYKKVSTDITKKFKPYVRLNEKKGIIEIYLTAKQKAFKFIYNEYRLYTYVTEQVVWLITILTGLLSAGWALFIARNQALPIRNLSDSIISFSRGDIDTIQKLEVRGSNEIRRAIYNFKIMANRILRHNKQRTNMLSGISHDLRTPLTRMKLLLAMAGKNKTNKDLSDNIKDMENMIESYLSFTKGIAKKSRVMNINKLLQNIINKWKNAGGKISYENGKSIKINANPDNIKRVIENIVTNGFKYGKNISIKLTTEDEFVNIIIEDDGSGIPEDKLDEVFNPFYRIDESRNKETGGAGLGLSVAMDIITYYGGNIVLENRKDKSGLIATITLPMIV
ncbi:MAG: sensor histidine kinase [Alphaproteobacteria bacterium]